jgi:hypothetical protein
LGIQSEAYGQVTVGKTVVVFRRRFVGPPLGWAVSEQSQGFSTERMVGPTLTEQLSSVVCLSIEIL